MKQNKNQPFDCCSCW